MSSITNGRPTSAQYKLVALSVLLLSAMRGASGRALLQSDDSPVTDIARSLQEVPWYARGSTGTNTRASSQVFSGQTGVDRGTVLSIVNAQRAAHGSLPLTYDDNLAVSALNWANQCTFWHSRSNSGNGENLSVTNNYVSALYSWYYSEVCFYNWNQPGYSEATGHFTQTVWASTRRIGCAVGNCPNGVRDISGRQLKGLLVVCHYGTAGNMNYGSMFQQNVKPILPGRSNPCKA